MIRGMTGHGRGEAEGGGLRVTADVRTLNHRFLDCEVRGPLSPDLEAEVRARVGSRVQRGRVEVGVTLDSGGTTAASVRVNVATMHAMAAGLSQVARDLGVADGLRLEHLAALPWARALEPAFPETDAAGRAAVLAAVDDALAGVVAMREREGADMAREMAARVGALKDHALAARQAAAAAAPAQAQRLRERMEELLAGLPADRGRLEQEAAIAADRADVTEEVVRLEAFLDRLSECLEGEGPQGKRLDFTLQEASREVNTMGAKSRSQDLSARVIEMKSELERLREMAANVE